MRVLIIDDSRANRMVLQKFMREFGLETVESENGLEAIWMLKQTPNIDVITVDYNMPRMTGVQFVRLVREKPQLDNIRILMITSEPQREVEAFEAGVNGFLVKPFDKEIIRAKFTEMGVEMKSGKSEAVTETPQPGPDQTSAPGGSQPEPSN
jgi:two-component system, chemotaxis family, chemotaxis protein CheY